MKFPFLGIAKKRKVPKKEIGLEKHQKIAYVSHQNFLFWKLLPYLVITKKGNGAGKSQKIAYVSHQNSLFW